MAVGLLMDFPDVTPGQYEAVVRDLGLDDKLPAGALVHSAGPTDSGWRIVDIWESPEAFATFAQEKLGPALQKIGVQPPVPQTWTVQTLLK